MRHEGSAPEPNMRVRLVRHNCVLHLPIDASIICHRSISTCGRTKISCSTKIERDYDSMFKRLSE